MVTAYAKIRLEIKKRILETGDPRTVLAEMVEGIGNLERLDDLKDLELCSSHGKDHPIYGDRDFCLDLKYSAQAGNEEFYLRPRDWLLNKCGLKILNFTRTKYVNKGYSNECKHLELRFLGNRIKLTLLIENPTPGVLNIQKGRTVNVAPL